MTERQGDKNAMTARQLGGQSLALERIDFSEAAEKRPVVRAARALNYFYCRAWHRLRVLTPCPIPRRGPAILVCNHTSGLDPALLQSACRRVIVWMMAREFYEARAVRWFYEAIQAIPVERQGQDMAVLRQGLRALEEGRVLGVFPEGRIERDGTLLPFHDGVAVMAVKAKCDIYPAYLDGTQRGQEMPASLLWPQRATVRFGPALRVADEGGRRAPREQVTARIVQAVERLRLESMTGRRLEAKTGRCGG